MRRGDFAGTGEVFSFTLRQYLKSKSTIAAMAVMVAVSIASLFIAAVSMSKGMVERTDIQRIVLADGVGSGVTAGDIRDCQPLFADAQIDFGGEAEGERTAVVAIEPDETGAIRVSAANAAGSSLERYDLSLAAQAVRSAVQRARLAGLETGAEKLERLAGAAPRVMSAGEYFESLEGAAESVDSDASYLVTYIYAILVMVLVNFSASYIVRSVIEEKASRLVEFLMVSVKPMALIAGKILASMCLVLIQLFVLAGGVALSWWISARVFGMSVISDLAASVGLGDALVNMGFGLVAAVIVSVLLAYAVFSLIGALAGVCCDSMEDMQSANGTVVMAVMAGYIVSVATSFMTGRTASAVLSLLPVVSAFTAPVRFAMGQIGFGVLALSWATQLLLVALLGMLCRRVYAALLIHRGSRVKFRQLFTIAREAKGGANA